MEIYTKKMVRQVKIIEKLLNMLETDLRALSKPENLKNVEELAVRVNKMHLYNHVQYASIRAHDHKDFSAITNAHKIIKEINEGWTKLAKEAAA